MNNQQSTPASAAECDQAQAAVDAASKWWSTSIIDIHPGEIAIRGYEIQDLIGRVSYPQMVWLMLRGDLPSAAQARLLEAALVAGVDHGPHAPSIAIARMAVTCGLPLNGAMASAVNALDDVHGGAGQQCMELFQQVASAAAGQIVTRELVARELDRYIEVNGKIIPGFGHRWHPVDPRATRLLAILALARDAGVVDGKFSTIAVLIEQVLAERKRAPIPLNIDGITAVIYAELGFAAELGRGLFILSRSVGILAHAWEQRQQGGRIKGPMSPAIPYTYTGLGRRSVREGEGA
jgi:citrate synthase